MKLSCFFLGCICLLVTSVVMGNFYNFLIRNMRYELAWRLECGFPSYRWSVSRCNSCKSGSKEICTDSKLLFFFWHDEDRILEKLYNEQLRFNFPFPFFGLKGFPKTGVKKRPSALHPTLTPSQSASSNQDAEDQV